MSTLLFKRTFQFLICFSVLCGCKHFAMTLTDDIKVINNTQHKMDIIVNHNYPDTTLANGRVSSYIDPKSEGGITLVNQKWEEYLTEVDTVTVFFTKWKPYEFFEEGKNGTQKVYQKLTLTKPILDSLGWKVEVNPKDIE